MVSVKSSEVLSSESLAVDALDKLAFSARKLAEGLRSGVMALTARVWRMNRSGDCCVYQWLCSGWKCECVCQKYAD